jgi:hypothetical protein
VVLLSALSLNGRVQAKAVEEVQPGPGPEVPFVVPSLLRLPDMLAVLTKTILATADTAYPVAYFSDHNIHHRDIHQSWCRTSFRLPDRCGGQAWSTANFKYDFNLEPYVRSRHDVFQNIVFLAGRHSSECTSLSLFLHPFLLRVAV